MEENKAVLYLPLIVFLMAFLLPVNNVSAFGGMIERERFQVMPSTNDRFGNTAGSYEPVSPVSPQPGPGQNKNELSKNTYEPPKRTSGRSGGFFVSTEDSGHSPYFPTIPSPEPSTPSSPPPSETPPPAQSPSAPEAPSWLTADEAKAYILLNDLRAKKGLSPLQADHNLTKVARLKAQDMIDNIILPSSPTYGTISQIQKVRGFLYQAGEILQSG